MEGILMWTSFRRTVAASIDLLLPPVCLLCGELLPIGHSLQSFCHDCSASMSPLGPAHCSRCAQPFPDSTSIHLCGNCLKRPPSFSVVHTAGIYKGGIKDAVQRLKYRNQISLARPLGQLLGKVIEATGGDFVPDCIVPVPLHLDRLRQRGYNQALEVTRPIAQQMSVPVDTRLLQRIRKTPPQQGLSAIERRSNLRNAFGLTLKPSAQRILLVDDVMTTGETVRECCRTLLAGGIREVQVAVVGRA
jgi:ComF family protein